MRSVPHTSSFSAAWWLFHGLVIATMCVAGVYLGQWLTQIVMEPVTTGDITSEWWQIFRKFVAVASGSLFLGVLVGYVLLILPDR